MTQPDVVVVGASAGGVEALTTLVGGLPADLPAAVLVVVHIRPSAESYLPRLLSRAGALPAAHAHDGEPIEHGLIYVAPPDHHLLVREGRIELTRGPRENDTRPAVDPLFRTAARTYGNRVIGVILSGALYDGTIGLMAVKARGGVAIVQDPEEAPVGGMPRSALRHVAADYVLPVSEMAEVLTHLIKQPSTDEGATPMVDDAERIEQVVAADFVAQAIDQRADERAIFSCPDCGGALWQAGAGPSLWFRCHVGHAYAPETLFQLKSEEIEAALWTSLRLLKEKATLTRQLATRGRESRDGYVSPRMEERARREEQYASAIEELLRALPAPVDEPTTGVAVSRRDDESEQSH
jgi:two-component system, chemotaxis family, protein-glutamate methylesterase/glutaminase